MKIILRVFILFIMCNFASTIYAIDTYTRQSAERLVSAYYRLLNNYAADPLNSSADKDVKQLFRDGDGEEPVYVDLYTIEGKTNTNQATLNNYLAKIGGLYNRDGIRLKFYSNPTSFEYSEYSSIKYKQSAVQDKVLFVSAIKEVSDYSGKISFKTREEFFIENSKINRIQLLPTDGKTRFKSAIDYYERKEYKKAFDLFTIEAEQQNSESAYWLSIMLLKKQGCPNLSSNVRNAMALFWLAKSSSARYYKATLLMNLLAVERKPCVDARSPINEGFISDINSKGKYGFIDVNGKVKVDYQYYDSRHFSHGLAAVKGGNGKWGYINENGILVIPYKYVIAYDFDIEGEADVALDKNQLVKIDKKGNLVNL